MRKYFWYYISVEACHFAFIFGILIFGRCWLPDNIVTFFQAITVFSQIITLSCPFTMLSAWLYKKGCPDVPIPSGMYYIYKKFGRKAAIPIFIALFIVSIYIADF